MVAVKFPIAYNLSERSWWLRYLIATGFVLVALTLNFLPPAQNLPFLFFFGAVALTARLCGFGPSLYATALSAIAADYFFIHPGIHWGFSLMEILRMLMFALVCLLIASLAQQRSKAQRAAEMNQARLAAIVQSSDDAILSKTLDGIITSWNKGAERLYGYTEAEVVGKHVSLLSPPELPNDIPMIMSKLRTGEQVQHHETTRIRKDGTRLDISVSVSPLHDLAGNVIGASTITRDITARKAAEETLRKTEKLAATGRLAASIAHEINNPLEAVTNLLYLLRKNPSLDEKGRKHLSFAEQELERVTHISRQTLGFYRQVSSPSRMDVAKTLESALSVYSHKLEGQSIKVETKWGSGTEIQALAGEIRQVFSNLIANSIDAMPQGGTLTLKVSKSHNWGNGNRLGVRVVIADTGSGIAPAQKSKLFEPFFTTKRDVGTGLGLWVSKSIVQKHEGSIKVRSSVRPGKSGTVFSVFLPESMPASAAA
jgi:two-component system, chemotaxis family, CheB/CheR fusion protein